MSFYIESIVFKPYPAQFQTFLTSPRHDIGKYLYRCGRSLRSSAKRTVPRDTGRLGASINIQSYKKGPLSAEITVGSNLNYAYYVHEGTHPHQIRSRPGRVLQFVHNGRVVYATKVHHPGTKPTRFLSEHLRTAIH